MMKSTNCYKICRQVRIGPLSQNCKYKRFWLLNDGKLHDSSLRYLFSHKVGYKSYAKANGSSLFKRQLRGPLFYESNESVSHESMSQGYFLTKYYILNNCLPVLKLA